MLDLPKLWGQGTTAAADGTKYDLYEQNLLSEYHIRYGGYGGIAYHHVADSYVALFSHFISCGTWEAVYIIEGLLQNQSDIQPASGSGHKIEWSGGCRTNTGRSQSVPSSVPSILRPMRGERPCRCTLRPSGNRVEPGMSERDMPTLSVATR